MFSFFNAAIIIAVIIMFLILRTSQSSVVKNSSENQTLFNIAASILGIWFLIVGVVYSLSDLVKSFFSLL